MNLVLYSDKSGVHGKWYKGEFGDWKFEPTHRIDMTEEDMKYLLKELKNIRNTKQESKR